MSTDKEILVSGQENHKTSEEKATLKKSTDLNKLVDFLLETPLFQGANPDLLKNQIELGGSLQTFHAGEEIISALKESEPAHFGVILSGSAKAFSNDTDRNVVLRAFHAGDAFGVSSVFSKDENKEPMSRITAKNTCRVLLITDAFLLKLLESDKTVMLNYLQFLSGRIRFLNKRIACFTAGSAERKLAVYLDSVAKGPYNKAEKVTLDIPLGTLASVLDVGRASLYRAIDCLTLDGFIEKDGKSFTLKDRKNMLKKYNR